MIVITSLNRNYRLLFPGDHFTMTVRDSLGCRVAIDEIVTVSRTINYIASFRFALEDGTCPGFHLTGVFANAAELPIELQNAVMFEDLPDDKKLRFAQSCGIDLSTCAV